MTQDKRLIEYCECECLSHRSCDYSGPTHCPQTQHMLDFILEPMALTAVAALGTAKGIIAEMEKK